MEQEQQQTKLPTEPNWNDAPYWAEWFAIDKDGTGHWYNGKPVIGKSVWRLTLSQDIRYRFVGKFDPSNWQNSLQKRPQ